VRLPAPFRGEGEHIAVDVAGARALFTTRRGGVSTGAFESLNLGTTTGDDPAAVAANRERVRLHAGGAALTAGRQVHEAAVHRVRSAAGGEASAPADGQATDARGVAPLVLVADCLPVAVAGEGAVAMLHAGWRGLAAGILEEGVAALHELGATGPLEAAIGPGAGGCCYTVGGEVRAAFAGHPEAHRDGRTDLKRIARERLAAAGVATVHDAGLCTICADRALFFSHRRDTGRTGRQAGVAFLH